MNQKKVLILTLIAIFTAGLIFWLGTTNNPSSQQANLSENAIEVVMYKNAGCLCCDKWASYLEEQGYDVAIEESMNTNALKDEHHVPGTMRSCHTALIDGYVVEGHVPVEDINRLLSERPEVVGITAPGMPASAPGMNTELNTPYDVYQFDKEGNTELYSSH
jgi:hypothetical protein